MSLDFSLIYKDKDSKESVEVYWKNITHNLVKMADKAGIYYALWRPEEKGWKHGRDIISVLEKGVKELESKPKYFKKFNPSNGWGDYEVLLEFTKETLRSCEKYPNAKIYKFNERRIGDEDD